jgi:hypothetical protein
MSGGEFILDWKPSRLKQFEEKLEVIDRIYSP